MSLHWRGFGIKTTGHVIILKSELSEMKPFIAGPKADITGLRTGPVCL